MLASGPRSCQVAAALYQTTLCPMDHDIVDERQPLFGSSLLASPATARPPAMRRVSTTDPQCHDDSGTTEAQNPKQASADGLESCANYIRITDMCV